MTCPNCDRPMEHLVNPPYFLVVDHWQCHRCHVNIVTPVKAPAHVDIECTLDESEGK